MNTLMPVGFILATADSRNPSTYLGGTWVAIQNRTIVGVGTHALDWTDGSETHAHTMNTHNHGLSSGYAMISRGVGATADYMAMIWKKYSTNFTSSLYMNTNSAVSATAKTSDGSTALGGTTDNKVATMQNASTLQPSVAKYLWQRTA